MILAKRCLIQKQGENEVFKQSLKYWVDGRTKWRQLKGCPTDGGQQEAGCRAPEGAMTSEGRSCGGDKIKKGLMKVAYKEHLSRDTAHNASELLPQAFVKDRFVSCRN